MGRRQHRARDKRLRPVLEGQRADIWGQPPVTAHARPQSLALLQVLTGLTSFLHVAIAGVVSSKLKVVYYMTCPLFI